MKIGELGRAAKISRDTIRHYVEIGLLKPKRDPVNRYQIFDSQALQRLRFIQTAKELGLSLTEIKQVFADSESQRSPCPRVRDLLIHRLAETRAQIERLTQLHDAMATAVEQWSAMPDGMPTGSSVCHLIESQMSQVHASTEPGGREV